MSAPYVNAYLEPLQSGLSLQRLLSSRLDLSPTSTVFRKFMTLCSRRERNLKEPYLEISEVMSLVHHALSINSERRCSGIGQHSDGNVSKLRRAGTTFEGEYLEAYSQAFQAVLP